MNELKINNKIVRIFASDKSWIEGAAVRQLEKTAELDGIVLAAGMPDMHPGKGSPVGAAFVSKGKFYPHIVGNDAGCGMGLWNTTLKANKMKIDKWTKKLADLENKWSGDVAEWLVEHDIDSGFYDTAHGTLGGGNHFAELQRVEKIYEQDIFERLNLDKKKLCLLIHSGSRGLGESVYRSHTDINGAGCLEEESVEAAEFLKKHDYAVRWASSNRSLIAKRFMSKVGGDCEPIIDISHNSISKININGEKHWLHRKGAVPSDSGAVIIPGSRGTLTYLVLPVGKQEDNLWSVAHGAGRKWDRGSCRGRLKKKWNAESLLKTELGGIVICENKELLYEEAPQAYKNIDAVIKDMTDAGLVKIIATFRPVITYKTRNKK